MTTENNQTSPCPHCGQPHPIGAGFCPITGKAIQRVPAACPRCGQSTQPDWVACPNCGMVFGQTPSPISKGWLKDLWERTPWFYPVGGLALILIVVIAVLAGRGKDQPPNDFIPTARQENNQAGQEATQTPRSLLSMLETPTPTTRSLWQQATSTDPGVAEEPAAEEPATATETPQVAIQPWSTPEALHITPPPILSDDLMVVEASMASRLKEIAQLGANQLLNIVFSPDQQWMAAASYNDDVITIWNWYNGTKVLTIPEDLDYLTTMAFNTQGNYLAIGTRQGSIKVWDLAQGKLIYNLSAHQKSITSLVFSSNGSILASASQDRSTNQVITWDMRSGRMINSLSGHEKFVQNLIISPDDKVLVSESSNDLKIWDLNRGTLIKTLEHTWSPTTNGLVFSSDGNTLASRSGNGTVKVWDATLWTERYILNRHPDVVDLIFSLNNNEMITASQDGSIKVWEVNGGTELKTLRSADNRITTSLALSPDGNWLALGTLEWIKILDPNNGQEFSAIGSNITEAARLRFSADGTRLAATTRKGTVQVLERQSGNLVASIPEMQANVNSLAYAPNKPELAVGLEDGSIHIWDLQTGQQQTVFTGHTGRINYLSYSPAGKYLASISQDRTMIVWNLETRAIEYTYAQERYAVNGLAFSPDGNYLAVAVTDGIVRVLETSSGTELRILDHQKVQVNHIAFSPDGATLATAGNDWNVRLWDWPAQTEIRTLGAHGKPVLRVAFSPDGSLLASGGEDGIKIWDLNSGLVKSSLTNERTTDLGFSLSGDLLIGATSRKFNIWSVSNGQLVATYQTEINLLSISPDGRLVANEDGWSVKLWGVR